MEAKELAKRQEDRQQRNRKFDFFVEYNIVKLLRIISVFILYVIVNEREGWKEHENG